jgi:hypothetical protein
MEVAFLSLAFHSAIEPAPIYGGFVTVPSSAVVAAGLASVPIIIFHNFFSLNK